MARLSLTKIKAMAEAHNAGPSLFKFSMSLGNLLSILTILVTVAPFGCTIIADNARLKLTVESINAQTTANISSINQHLSSIDETAQQAKIDDILLKRVQDDIKDIRIRLENIESRFHLRAPNDH